MAMAMAAAAAAAAASASASARRLQEKIAQVGLLEHDLVHVEERWELAVGSWKKCPMSQKQVCKRGLMARMPCLPLIILSIRDEYKHTTNVQG